MRIYKDTIPFSNKIKRIIWEVVWLFLFRPTHRRFGEKWRIFLLKLFGAKIGSGCRVSNTCKIWAPWNLVIGNYSALADNVDCYCMDVINIGSYVTVSQRAFLCGGSHDISKISLPLICRGINIDDHAWVCSEAFIGPGTSIGKGAVVAARAVVVKNVGDWNVVGGNPAVFLKTRILSE